MIYRPPKCCDPRSIVRKDHAIVERCKHLTVTGHTCTRRWADGRGPERDCPSRLMISRRGKK